MGTDENSDALKAPDYVIERLGPQHDRKAFACGEPALDIYLKTQVSQDVKRDLAVCYTLCERDAAEIIGYYTLSASSLELQELPPELAKKAGRYPLIPAILLGRLALDQRYQGHGLSELLLLNALRRALRTGVGAKFLIVDALNERAASFYAHYNFHQLPDHPLKLYLPMSAIRDLFPGEGDSNAGDMN